MDEVKKAESHMISAAAFVEGGIQDASDDACSICLEAFCDNDPSTVTSCKHEFHLQCVLEWCQRSSNCPMCWQPISLKDPASQELLKGVERERSFLLTPSRNATIFHHPTLGDFELPHLPLGVDDSELEDRIIQHLAARRTHRLARREGSRSRSSAHARPEFVLLSTQPNESSTGPGSVHGQVENEPSAVHNSPISASSSESLVTPNTHKEVSNDDRSHVGQSSSPNKGRAGPSEFQSFSDTWKSKLDAMSTKYKKSFSKNTRGWKEKLFSRSSSMADIGSEVKREVNNGIATVSRLMEHLETRDNNNRTGPVVLSNDHVDSSVNERVNHVTRGNPNEEETSTSASIVASSISR